VIAGSLTVLRTRQIPYLQGLGTLFAVIRVRSSTAKINSMKVAAAFTLAICFAVHLAGQSNPFKSQPAENPFVTASFERYIGQFESDKVILNLDKIGNEFEGTLYYSTTKQTYSVKASVTNLAMEGVFRVDQSDFKFTFLIEEGAEFGKFDTEGYSGQLRKNIDKTAALSGDNTADDLFEEAIDLASKSPIDAQGSLWGMLTTYYQSLGNHDKAGSMLRNITAEMDPYNIWRQMGHESKDILPWGKMSLEETEKAYKKTDGLTAIYSILSL